MRAIKVLQTIPLRAFLAGAVAFLLGVLPGHAMDTLTVGLVTPVSISQAPFFMGTDLGYFKAEDIEYELLTFNGTGTLVPQLSAKRVDIGYPNPDFLILARQPGKDYLPVRFFYNVARESVWEITVLASSKAQTLADLKGAKLGVFTLSQGSIPITRAMFSDHNIKIGQDIELIAVGGAITSAQALNAGRVDALNVFDVVNATMAASGTKLRQLPMDQKYRALFSNGYVAHDDTIKAKGKQLAAFGRAWTKSAIACNTNIDACVRSFWRHNPTLKTAGNETDQLPKQASILRSRMEKLMAFQAMEKHQFGAYTDEAWRNFITLLHEQKQIASTDIKLDTLYTGEFVKDFNNFDFESVKIAAKALQ
jgi:NitT/TauT family transport system substrate-binding protein